MIKIGEKNAGLWLIVIVVIIAGLLIVMLNQFYPDAVQAVYVPIMDVLNDLGLEWGSEIEGEEPVPEGETPSPEAE